MNDAPETLVREFERNPVFGYLSPYELYRNWLEAIWAFMEAPTDPAGFRSCLDRYTAEQGAGVRSAASAVRRGRRAHAVPRYPGQRLHAAGR